MTQLDAVNIMLSAIGEAPVEVIEGVTDPDVVMAVNVLNETRRELCLQPWKFNTEDDLELAYDDTLTWTEPDATTTDLYVFYFPTGLNSFQMYSITEQLGSNLISVVARQAKQYTTGEPATRPMVFYDRLNNRDGFPQDDDRTSIWIDAVWDQTDWNYLPPTARRLIAVIAANRFAAKAVGSEKLVAFSQDDVKLATRNFMRDQSPARRHNALLQPDLVAAMGDRIWSVAPRYSNKGNRRP